MENKILIGQNMNKKGIIAGWCWLSFYGFLGAIPTFNYLKIYANTSTELSLFISIIIFLTILIFLTPILGSNETIEFSNNYVSYFHTKGFSKQLIEVIRILKSKNAIADICMKTKDIEKMNISYVPYTMAWAQKGYKIKFTFLLNDGTTLSIYPTSFDQMEKGDYEKALRILENNGVEIIDKLDLRKALSMNKNDYYQYILSIDDGKSKL
ncbi:MAG: hypothetical protein RR585_09625 [Coprobacillus sp.]